MKPRSRYNCLPALALLACLPATATTVYKSVDDQGVVSFSDTAPEEDTLIERVEIDTPPASDDGDSRDMLEEMRETTDRMAADRMAREKHRAEMRELQAKTDALRQPQYEEPYRDYYDYPRFYTGGYYHRKHHHRPIRPHPRPPLRPQPRPDIHDRFPAPHIRPLFTPRTRGAPR